MSNSKNLVDRAVGEEKAGLGPFACEVEREALKLIKEGCAPYNALDKARQSIANHFVPPGEQVVMKDYTLVQKMLRNYDPAIVDRRISPKDTMIGDNYFQVGASAVQVKTSACMASYLTEVTRVLDLPCGHGRVLRHLIPLFPDAEFHACDLDKEGLEYCHATFGARPILSCEDLAAVKFDTTYDLIWVGSLFTHTNYEFTKSGFEVLAHLLSSRGIVVATLHGRWATRLHSLIPYTDEGTWTSIIKGFEANGYGYADYKKGESHDFISANYGVSIARPHAIIRMLEAIPGIRIYMYQEKAWADNHDVVVFGRPGWEELGGADDIDEREGWRQRELGNFSRTLERADGLIRRGRQDASRMLLMRAVALIGLGRCSEAEKSLREALQPTCRSGYVYLELGRLLAAEGRTDEAEAVVVQGILDRSAVGAGRQHFVRHLFEVLGEIWEKSDVRHGQIQAIMERLRTELSNEPEVWVMGARVDLFNGHRHAALQSLRRAEELGLTVERCAEVRQQMGITPQEWISMKLG